MTSAHTPGPWKIDPRSNIIRGQDGAPVATLGYRVTAPEPCEDDANARLIASAPSLLSACEAAESLLSNITQLSRPDRTVSVASLVKAADDCARALRSALSQARGGAS